MGALDLEFELGAVAPRLDVKVGDLVDVVIAEGRAAEGGGFEMVRVVNTFEVASVDDLTKGSGRDRGQVHRWCRGPIVASSAAKPELYIGNQGMAHMGVVSEADRREDVPVRRWR